MIRIILAVLFTVGAMQSFDLGMMWINEGHGLHPLIAFGAMFINIFAILCLLAYAWLLKHYPELPDACSKLTKALEQLSSGYHP